MANPDMRRQYSIAICFFGIITISILAAGVATTSWTVAELERINQTSCHVTRTLGLFSLTDESNGDCTRGFIDVTSIYNTEYIDFNHGLQYAVIAFCALSMLMSLVTITVAAFNICANPYELYLTPIAMLAYNVTGMGMSLVAIILYTVLLYTELYDPLLDSKPDDPEELTNVYKTEYNLVEDAYFGYSFFLIVVSIVTYLVGIAFAVLTDRDVVMKCFKPKEEDNNNKAQDIMMF